ncbi:hypothetical protein M9434_004651 [Picochlorum sp. BPE23]|nr:hypothetical protein M9434_004651 [Picochlorum sp. BPE23]
MKLLKKKKSKGRQELFYFDIDELSPWPPLHGPLILQWQRGSKRRGQSGVVQPEGDGDSEPTSYKFGTRFEIPATLYDDGKKRKDLSLFVCQLNEKGKVGNMVGAVTIDLGGLDSLTSQPARQEYIVECSKSIAELAQGRPKLRIGLSKSGGVEGDAAVVHDEGQGVSNDIPIPSTLSTEVNSSQASGGNVASLRTITSPRSKVVVPEMVEEEYDEDGFLVDGSEDKSLSFMPEDREDLLYSSGTETRKNLQGDLEKAMDEDTEDDLSPFRASRRKPIHERRFSRDVNSFGSLQQFKGEEDAVTGLPSMVASCNSTMLHAREKDESGYRQKRDMQIAAAVEMSVWAAGASWGSDRPGEMPRGDRMQAPARRLARTIIRLGEEDGPKFMDQALHMIKKSCVASLGDVHRVMMMWSCMVTLRWSFWTLVDKSRPAETRMAGFEWLQEIICPRIEAVESWLFDTLLSYLWTGKMMRDLQECRDADSLDQLVTDYMSVLRTALGVLEDRSRPAPCSKTLKMVLKKQVLHGIRVKLDAFLLSELLEQRVSCFRPVTSPLGLELKIFIDKVSTWFESDATSTREFGQEEWYNAQQDTKMDSALPRMASAANVIVAQKSSLLDAEARDRIAPHTSLASACKILKNYESTKEDAENVEEIVAALKSQARSKIDLKESSEAMDSVQYVVPPEDWLSQQGIIQPLSLEMNAESDEELESFESVGGERFTYLRELWSVVF